MKTKKRKVTVSHDQLLEMLDLLDDAIWWQRNLVRCEIGPKLSDSQKAQLAQDRKTLRRQYRLRAALRKML